MNMKSSLKTLITLFLALILITSSCKFIEEKGWFGKSKKAKEEAALKAAQESIRVADSIKAATEKMRAIEQARLDSVMAVEQAQRMTETMYKYHIIVGSFLTPAYADDYQKYYRSLGYDAQIIPDSRNRFNLVSAEAHDNLNQAIGRLYRFQDTVEFEAWLYIKE
jgi:hypothetical protein